MRSSASAGRVTYRHSQVRLPLLQSTALTVSEPEREALVAALPRGHALAGEGPLALADLAREPFVMYTSTGAAGLHAACMLACQSAGFVPRVAQEAVQVQTVLALIESGLGVALAPAVAQAHGSERLVYRPLTDPQAEPAIGMALVSAEPAEVPAAMRFREVALRTCAA